MSEAVETRNSIKKGEAATEGQARHMETGGGTPPLGTNGLVGKAAQSPDPDVEPNTGLLEPGFKYRQEP